MRLKIKNQRRNYIFVYKPIGPEDEIIKLNPSYTNPKYTKRRLNNIYVNCGMILI